MRYVTKGCEVWVYRSDGTEELIARMKSEYEATRICELLEDHQAMNERFDND